MLIIIYCKDILVAVRSLHSRNVCTKIKKKSKCYSKNEVKMPSRKRNLLKLNAKYEIYMRSF